jgi:hypothetical protein
MRILFFVRHKGYVANFDSTLRLLGERGDRVHLALDRLDKWPKPGSVTASLAQDYPNVSFGPAPSRDESDTWVIWGEQFRAAINYLLYLEPEFEDAGKLRARIERKTPLWAKRLAGLRPFEGARGRDRLRRIWRALERLAPPDRDVEKFIRDFDPDIVLVTPLVVGQSPQTEYVRAAKRLEKPTGLCVASWDNLTTKGVVHEMPGFVTLWNEGMKREAVRLHGVPEDTVVVTGAQTYDHWFGWRPSEDRERFCRKVGLKPELPILLYLCSSSFIAGSEEPEHVEAWIRSLRRQPGFGPDQVQVLVRPHPSNAPPWEKYDPAALGPGVAIWPEPGWAQQPAERKTGFYDSIHHSGAVVGVNTSALIESAIVGRSVHTVRAPRMHGGQEGTVHFSLISEFGGGIVNMADSPEEHAAQLRAVLDGDGGGGDRRRRFLEAFVRPHGLERPAAPILVDAIDGAVRRGAGQPLRVSPRDRTLRSLLSPAAHLLARRVRRDDSKAGARRKRRRKRRIVGVRRLRRLAGAPIARLRGSFGPATDE